MTAPTLRLIALPDLASLHEGTPALKLASVVATVSLLMPRVTRVSAHGTRAACAWLSSEALVVDDAVALICPAVDKGRSRRASPGVLKPGDLVDMVGDLYYQAKAGIQAASTSATSGKATSLEVLCKHLLNVLEQLAELDSYGSYGGALAAALGTSTEVTWLLVLGSTPDIVEAGRFYQALKDMLHDDQHADTCICFIDCAATVADSIGGGGGATTGFVRLLSTLCPDPKPPPVPGHAPLAGDNAGPAHEAFLPQRGVVCLTAAQVAAGDAQSLLPAFYHAAPSWPPGYATPEHLGPTPWATWSEGDRCSFEALQAALRCEFPRLAQAVAGAAGATAAAGVGRCQRTKGLKTAAPGAVHLQAAVKAGRKDAAGLAVGFMSQRAAAMAAVGAGAGAAGQPHVSAPVGSPVHALLHRLPGPALPDNQIVMDNTLSALDIIQAERRVCLDLCLAAGAAENPVTYADVCNAAMAPTAALVGALLRCSVTTMREAGEYLQMLTLMPQSPAPSSANPSAGNGPAVASPQPAVQEGGGATVDKVSREFVWRLLHKCLLRDTTTIYAGVGAGKLKKPAAARLRLIRLVYRLSQYLHVIYYLDFDLEALQNMYAKIVAEAASDAELALRSGAALRVAQVPDAPAVSDGGVAGATGLAVSLEVPTAGSSLRCTLTLFNTYIRPLFTSKLPLLLGCVCEVGDGLRDEDFEDFGIGGWGRRNSGGSDCCSSPLWPSPSNGNAGRRRGDWDFQASSDCEGDSRPHRSRAADGAGHVSPHMLPPGQAGGPRAGGGGGGGGGSRAANPGGSKSGREATSRPQYVDTRQGLRARVNHTVTMKPGSAGPLTHAAATARLVAVVPPGGPGAQLLPSQRNGAAHAGVLAAGRGAPQLRRPFDTTCRALNMDGCADAAADPAAAALAGAGVGEAPCSSGGTPRGAAAAALPADSSEEVLGATPEPPRLPGRLLRAPAALAATNLDALFGAAGPIRTKKPASGALFFDATLKRPINPAVMLPACQPAAPSGGPQPASPARFHGSWPGGGGLGGGGPSGAGGSRPRRDSAAAPPPQDACPPPAAHSRDDDGGSGKDRGAGGSSPRRHSAAAPPPQDACCPPGAPSGDDCGGARDHGSGGRSPHRQSAAAPLAPPPAQDACSPSGLRNARRATFFSAREAHAMACRAGSARPSDGGSGGGSGRLALQNIVQQLGRAGPPAAPQQYGQPSCAGAYNIALHSAAAERDAAAGVAAVQQQQQQLPMTLQAAEAPLSRVPSPVSAPALAPRHGGAAAKAAPASRLGLPPRPPPFRSAAQRSAAAASGLLLPAALQARPPAAAFLALPLGGPAAVQPEQAPRRVDGALPSADDETVTASEEPEDEEEEEEEQLDMAALDRLPDGRHLALSDSSSDGGSSDSGGSAAPGAKGYSSVEVKVPAAAAHPLPVAVPAAALALGHGHARAGSSDAAPSRRLPASPLVPPAAPSPRVPSTVHEAAHTPAATAAAAAALPEEVPGGAPAARRRKLLKSLPSLAVPGMQRVDAAGALPAACSVGTRVGSAAKVAALPQVAQVEATAALGTAPQADGSSRRAAAPPAPTPSALSVPASAAATPCLSRAVLPLRWGLQGILLPGTQRTPQPASSPAPAASRRAPTASSPVLAPAPAAGAAALSAGAGGGGVSEGVPPAVVSGVDLAPAAGPSETPGPPVAGRKRGFAAAGAASTEQHAAAAAAQPPPPSAAVEPADGEDLPAVAGDAVAAARAAERAAAEEHNARVCADSPPLPAPQTAPLKPIYGCWNCKGKMNSNRRGCERCRPENLHTWIVARRRRKPPVWEDNPPLASSGAAEQAVSGTATSSLAPRLAQSPQAASRGDAAVAAPLGAAVDTAAPPRLAASPHFQLGSSAAQGEPHREAHTAAAQQQMASLPEVPCAGSGRGCGGDTERVGSRHLGMRPQQKKRPAAAAAEASAAPQEACAFVSSPLPAPLLQDDAVAAASRAQRKLKKAAARVQEGRHPGGGAAGGTRAAGQSPQTVSRKRSRDTVPGAALARML